MPTYVYETIPRAAGEAPRRFEVQQSMRDDPLTTDPETGVPVKRVISGGLEIPRAKADPRRTPDASAAHSDSCACCHPPRR